MSNNINTGNIEFLNPNEVILTQAIKVAGGKIQLEFAEIISDNSNLNPLSLFNKSDDRFSGGRARRAWLTAEPTDASQILGVSLDESQPWKLGDNNKMVLPLNILNPVANIGGVEYKLRVEIVETTTPTQWQMENMERAAKRRGANGDFITHQGKYIFVNSRIAFNQAKHVFLTADERTVDANHLVNQTLSVDFSSGEILS